MPLDEDEDKSYNSWADQNVSRKTRQKRKCIYKEMYLSGDVFPSGEDVYSTERRTCDTSFQLHALR